MTPADAIARADRDAAATQARLASWEARRDYIRDAALAHLKDRLDYIVPGVMALNRARLSQPPDLLRRLLADSERDLYLETVAARGIDPMSERSQAAEKDER